MLSVSLVLPPAATTECACHWGCAVKWLCTSIVQGRSCWPVGSHEFVLVLVALCVESHVVYVAISTTGASARQVVLRMMSAGTAHLTSDVGWGLMLRRIS